MLYIVGEILADVFDAPPKKTVKVGGAPLNVAAWAADSGADAVFYGAVGGDEYGKEVLKQASRLSVRLDVDVIDDAATTVAEVSLDENGERNFRFFRDNTAEFRLSTKKIDKEAFKKCTIVHMGSLMLTAPEGRRFAQEFIELAKAQNKIVSFDYNYRADLYPDFSSSVKASKEIVGNANLLKFSEEEILQYTDKSNVFDALKCLSGENRLVVCTCGARGCDYCFGNNIGHVDGVRANVVDTTGAGDAFWGAALALLDGTDFWQLSAREIERILAYACTKGAEATTFYGAIKL